MRQDVLVRSYAIQDRGSVRDIAWETAFLGESAGVFFDDKEVLADFLTRFFTDHEPGSCFVAEHKGKVVGYIFGAKNVRRMKGVFLGRILGPLVFKAIGRLAFFRKKNAIFLLNCFGSFLKHEFRVPDFSKDYPATLHINVRDGYRGMDVGSALMTAYLGYLKKGDIPGVYLTTTSEKAKNFFEKHGFIPLHKGRKTHFWYLTHRDTPFYILGQKIR